METPEILTDEQIRLFVTTTSFGGERQIPVREMNIAEKEYVSNAIREIILECKLTVNIMQEKAKQPPERLEMIRNLGFEEGVALLGLVRKSVRMDTARRKVIQALSLGFLIVLICMLASPYWPLWMYPYVLAIYVLPLVLLAISTCYLIRWRRLKKEISSHELYKKAMLPIR